MERRDWLKSAIGGLAGMATGLVALPATAAVSPERVAAVIQECRIDAARKRLLKEHPGLELIEGVHFRDKVVSADGKMFFRCIFVNASLCGRFIVGSHCNFYGPLSTVRE
jgi:hypothetical protein